MEQKNADSRLGSGRNMRLVLTARNIAVIAIVVIAIAVLLDLASNPHGTPVLNSNRTFTITNGQSAYFEIGGSKGRFALLLKNTTSTYSVVYISRVPVLINPITVFGISKGQSVNISTAGTGVADVQVKLISSSSRNATLELVPIPSLFAIKPSPGVEIMSPASLYSNSTVATNSIIVPTVPQNANSAVQNSSSNAIVVQPTTSPAPPPSHPGSTPLENISVLLNTTYIATLMNNLNALYVQDQACTASGYNTTFLAYRSQIPGAAGEQPVGSFDFANQSMVTPRSVSVSATQQGRNLYAVAYSVVARSSQTSGRVVSFNFTGDSGVVTNLKFQGIFYGENYTDVNSAYAFQRSISGNCGAYIP